MRPGERLATGAALLLLLSLRSGTAAGTTRGVELKDELDASIGRCRYARNFLLLRRWIFPPGLWNPHLEAAHEGGNALGHHQPACDG